MFYSFFFFILLLYLIVKCFKNHFFGFFFCKKKKKIEKNIGSAGSTRSSGSAVCNPQFSNTPYPARFTSSLYLPWLCFKVVFSFKVQNYVQLLFITTAFKFYSMILLHFKFNTMLNKRDNLALRANFVT